MTFRPLSRAAALALLLLLYAGSIGLRVPHLHRPLSGFGFSTAHTLIVLENFARLGPAHFHYLPVVSYQNPGDRGIVWAGFKMQLGSDGNYYHTAYPFLSYLIEHFVFKACGVSPSVAAIENLNLILCGISALLIFLIIERALRDRPAGRWAALLGAGLYLFVPSTLIFQANSFFVDMMVQPFLISCIYCAQRLFEAPAQKRWWFCTGSMIFLTALTEWSGFLTLGVLLVVSWWALPWRRHWRGLLGLCGAATLALVIFILLYGQITSYPELFKYLVGKYTTYSGVHGEERSHFLANLGQMRRFYFWYTGPLVFALAVNAALLALARVPVREWLRSSDLRTCAMAGGPVALHILLLFTFNSHHDYATLKALPFLAIATALLGQRVLSLTRPQRRLVICEAAVAAAAIVSSVVIYRQVWRVEGSLAPSLAGAELAHAAQPAQVLAVETPIEAPDPRLHYAAGRNIYVYHGDEALREHLRQQQLREAVIVSMDGTYRLGDSRLFALP